MAVTTQRDFVALALAPSQTEQEKAARTHNMIRGHLESDPWLKKYAIHTYLQGSYANSTNVRGDSDVDMGSRTTQVFYHETRWLPSGPRYRNGLIVESLKDSVDHQLNALGRGGFTYREYRADVLASLQRQYDNVTEGNKAITVAGNTSRLDADVLPCIEFRLYYQNATGDADYHSGILFFTTSSDRIVNFPEQHYENLKNKDQANNGKVKGCIRILKRLRNELEERGRWDRKRSPSFYLESLVWNAPDGKFEGGYETVVQNVLLHLYHELKAMRERGDASPYRQANKVFPLFGDFFGQTFWNVDDAIAFIEVIWGAAFGS